MKLVWLILIYIGGAEAGPLRISLNSWLENPDEQTANYEAEKIEHLPPSTSRPPASTLNESTYEIREIELPEMSFVKAKASIPHEPHYNLKSIDPNFNTNFVINILQRFRRPSTSSVSKTDKSVRNTEEDGKAGTWSFLVNKGDSRAPPKTNEMSNDIRRRKRSVTLRNVLEVEFYFNVLVSNMIHGRILDDETAYHNHVLRNIIQEFQFLCQIARDHRKQIEPMINLYENGDIFEAEVPVTSEDSYRHSLANLIHVVCDFSNETDILQIIADMRNITLFPHRRTARGAESNKALLTLKVYRSLKDFAKQLNMSIGNASNHVKKCLGADVNSTGINYDAFLTWYRTYKICKTNAALAVQATNTMYNYSTKYHISFDNLYPVIKQYLLSVDAQGMVEGVTLDFKVNMMEIFMLYVPEDVVELKVKNYFDYFNRVYKIMDIDEDKRAFSTYILEPDGPTSCFFEIIANIIAKTVYDFSLPRSLNLRATIMYYRQSHDLMIEALIEKMKNSQRPNISTSQKHVIERPQIPNIQQFISEMLYQLGRRYNFTVNQMLSVYMNNLEYLTRKIFAEIKKMKAARPTLTFDQMKHLLVRKFKGDFEQALLKRSQLIARNPTQWVKPVIARPDFNSSSIEQAQRRKFKNSLMTALLRYQNLDDSFQHPSINKHSRKVQEAHRDCLRELQLLGGIKNHSEDNIFIVPNATQSEHVNDSAASNSNPENDVKEVSIYQAIKFNLNVAKKKLDHYSITEQSESQYELKNNVIDNKFIGTPVRDEQSEHGNDSRTQQLDNLKACLRELQLLRGIKNNSETEHSVANIFTDTNPTKSEHVNDFAPNNPNPENDAKEVSIYQAINSNLNSTLYEISQRANRP